MKNMTLREIAEACHGRYVGDESRLDIEVTGVTSDSRVVEEDFLFAALKGERVDGHRFVNGSFEKGAACALVEEIPADVKGPVVVVESTYQALKDLAEHYRIALGIPIVGIVGSVGKTSTKEMVASVLEQKFRVLKTQGNFNNELGVPLTIFRIRPEHEIAVLEMGISDFGEMHRLSRMARPNMVVMTNIGQCHLENLKDRDGILRAKSEVYDYTAPDCTAILNGDDDKLLTLKGREGIRPCFFGLGTDNDVSAINVDNMGLEGTSCDLVTGAGTVHVNIPIPGGHMAYNAAAGAAVGLAMGMTLEEIKQGIEALKPTGGRNNIIRGKKYIVIDDCYNANPVSMRASIDVLAHAKGRRVAILGDMGELGANEVQLHEGVGEYAARAGIDVIVCVGKLSAAMAEAARAETAKAEASKEESAKAEVSKAEASKAESATAEGCENGHIEVLYLPDRDALEAALPEILKEGDNILVKASHFMDFPKIVEDIRRMDEE